MINTLIKILYKLTHNIEKCNVKYNDIGFYKKCAFTINGKDCRIMYSDNSNEYLYSFNWNQCITDSFSDEMSKLEFLKAFEHLKKACIEYTKSQFISFSNTREKTDEID